MGGLGVIDIVAIGAVFLLILSRHRDRRADVVPEAEASSADLIKPARRERDGATDSQAAKAGVRVVRLFHDGNEFEAVLPGFGKRAAGPIAQGPEEAQGSGDRDARSRRSLMIAVASSVGVFVGVWVFTQHVPGAAIAGGG
jgi:hypothetical protein